MAFSRSAFRRAKCTTFSDIPPLRNTLCAVAWSSASTDSISFLPSMLVRSRDSRTGRRSCASSSVKVRDIVYTYSTPRFRVNGFTNDERPTTALLDFQHPVQRHLCPMLHVVSYFDLVDYIAFNQILQRPAQMLRRNAEHGRAQAAGIIERDDLLPFRGKFRTHAIHQV